MAATDLSENKGLTATSPETACVRGLSVSGPDSDVPRATLLDAARYEAIIRAKSGTFGDHGFAPTWMPDELFAFQQSLVEWACVKGRAAIFADCGMGKTPMQLAWAENVARHSGGRVLILAPLAVAFQTVREGEKFGVEVTHRRDGLHDGDRVVVTNYERLGKFDPNDFAGVICDESSILKNFAGKTRHAITDFLRTRPYRLLCTATASPNDYVELGTSSEALGVMPRSHMMAQFFTHDGGETSKWRIKGHAREHLFWRWVCSWARACRKPSDLGFDDGDFILPELTLREHVAEASKPLDGYLFDLPAIGLAEQRADLKRTLGERCGIVADLCNAHDDAAVCWANLNAEADAIAKSVSGAVNVQGSDSDDAKEEAFMAFANGDVRVIVSKPSIAGFGLNWQHCNRMTFFPSHSYEQYYQSVRRCWRFGQTRPVTVDIVTTEGQQGVMRNMERKAKDSERMFAQMVALMGAESRATTKTKYQKEARLPSWL